MTDRQSLKDTESKVPRNDRIISIPSSPATSASPTSSASPNGSPERPMEFGSLLMKEEVKDKDRSKRRKRYLKERVRSCRERTLESEICKAINKYLNSCLNDDKSRRIIAILIMLLAIVGLYHIIFYTIL